MSAETLGYIQSSGFLDLHTPEELAQLVDSSHANRTASASPSQPTTTDRTALASLYLMIAIGAQVRGSSPDDSVRASKYFTQGRKIAFEKWLEDPTVNLVRTFVLMAFYMCGACRRNSAFMYLGVAAKSADILGLHAAAQNRHMSKGERDSRLVHLGGGGVKPQKQAACFVCLGLTGNNAGYE